ncbi:Protein of unknown function (DUF3435) domain containing protein [Rhypophila decipiens]
MPKARSKFAEAKGYTADIDAVDNKAVPREVLDYTKDVCQVQMDLWVEFKDDLYRKKGTVVSPHDLPSLKLFAEFIGESTPGVLDPSGKPTVQTVRNHFRRFVSGWNRKNHDAMISRDHTDSVTNDIKTRIRTKLGLSLMTRTRTYITLENYMYLERQLWENDPHDYVHEAYRVFISAKLKDHLYTPARLGELSEGSTRRKTGEGLRYRDTVLLVAWKNGRPELRRSLKREFAKGMHNKPGQRPNHILYEDLPDQLLVVQPMVFSLAMFLAAGAIKRCKTIEQVLAVVPPKDGRQWVFEWEEHVLDWPIYPEVSADGPVWQKIQSGSSFNTQLAGLSDRAGLQERVQVHSGRREAILKATENGYSNDELLKFAAHTNQVTRTRDYISSICSVDGQGSFLGTELRRDTAEDFRSATVRRNPELLLSLPAKEQDELQGRRDYVDVVDAIESLTRQINALSSMAAIDSLKSQRAELYERRRRLEHEELLKIRKTQERFHPSDRPESFHVDQHRTRFSRLRHMMPSRSQLADLLFLKAPLRSPEGVMAIEHLISLIKDPCRVAYQPPLQPLHGT